MSSPLLVGHLVSGGGTTMANVARQMQAGKLGDTRPAVVIADRTCDAVGKAIDLGIPTSVITKAEFEGHKWAQEIARVLEAHKVDIVFQNGWIPITPQRIIHRWLSSIYNQHPGPLSGGLGPDFGGKGMCGAAVSAARLLYLLESGEENPNKLTTESTVHMVTSGLDKGHLVRVVPFNIAEHIEFFRGRGIRTIDQALGDTGEFDMHVKLVQSGLLEVEHANVAAVLADRAQGFKTEVHKEERVITLDPTILAKAKAAAIKIYPTK